MRISIFLKTFFILIIIGIVPVLIFSFLTLGNYQEIIDKYNPYIEIISPKAALEVAIAYDQVKVQMLFILSLVVILIIITTFLISRSLTGPIRKLTQGAEKIAKGNLNVKIDIKTKDELGLLSDSFNKMVKDLKKSKTSLEEERASLKIKVKARTKEIEEERAGLEEQVGERTKELQEKIEQLEKFNRLAVGRELKMIELKKEIEELKKELEKY